MVTLVGTQGNIIHAIQNLIELDYDAAEAYEVAIDRIGNEAYKAQLRLFKADHLRHIQELSAYLQKQNEEVPEGPSLGKQWLTKGKVVLADIIGDHTILIAMRSNEIDTNTAYERIAKRNDKPIELLDTIDRGLQDEKRHKAWLDSATH
jgi:rubrerythrin